MAESPVLGTTDRNLLISDHVAPTRNPSVACAPPAANLVNRLFSLQRNCKDAVATIAPPAVFLPTLPRIKTTAAFRLGHRLEPEVESYRNYSFSV